MSLIKWFLFKKKKYQRFQNYDDEEYRNSIDEIIVHSNRHSCEPSTSIAHSSNSSEPADNFSTCIQASNIKALLNDTNKVLLLKLKIASKPTSAELNEVGQQCLKKSMIILLTIDNDSNYFLYWKSKDIGYFLTFKIYDQSEFMNDLRFFEFLTNFLCCSLYGEHLGLQSKVPLKSGASTFQLDHLADHRDYNLLLVAAELGDAYIVQLMLTLGLSSESSRINAQTLAWKNRHFEVLSILLRSNLIYPYTIYIDECPNDIQEFYELSRRLNEAIMLRDETAVLRILTQNSDMIHFYNLNNESALAFALKHKLFNMYKLLISKNILLGPHEKFSVLTEDMKESDREKLREIHYDESQNLPDNHMHVLLSNSRLGHDTSDSTKKYEIIQKAFETMNQNKFIQIILMIVAASRNFRIIFDFNRDSVEVVDPTADESTDGLFYSDSGRIYIGAKKLLDQNNRLEALGVMAHELCHYVMCLVYKNYGNPYASANKDAEREFKEISRICLENAGKERIVDVVHVCYPPSFHHAELVVRVPHLIMKYLNNPEKFNTVKVIYSKLFDVFEGKIYKDLCEALPKIEAKAETEKEKSKRKIKKLRMVSIIIAFLAIVLIIASIYVAWFVFYKPIYKFSTLSRQDQILVENAPVIYKNVNIVFHDLFPENSKTYDLLTSQDIYQMLENIPMNFSDPHYLYLDKLVVFNWHNLTGTLKDKFINSNFSFQGKTLSYKFLNESHPVVFNSLSSSQIIKVLDDDILSIHKMTKNGTQSYIERKIFIEYIYEMYFLFMAHLNDDILNSFCMFENTTGTANDTFDKFYDEFMSLDFHTRKKKIKKITYFEGFVRCLIEDFKIVDPNTKTATDSLFAHKNLQLEFRKLLSIPISNSIINQTRLFAISADSFAETTLTFQSFPFGIKTEYSTQWITYLDFRFYEQFTETYLHLKDVENTLEQVQGLSSDNEFERKIFEQLFYSGNVIFFWDGFDQMFDDRDLGVLNFVKLIQNLTQNFQFISTSSFYSYRYRSKNIFRTKAFTLVPLDEELREKLLYEYFLLQNISQTEIPIYIQKVQRILNITELKQNLNTPLMLEMIAYTITNDIKVFKSENIFEIYGKYAEIKVKNSVNESEFKQEFITHSLVSGFSIVKFYQKHAIMCLDIISNIKFASLRLEIMNTNLPKLTKVDDISKMGILEIKSSKVYKFIHSTFAEYFTAQYLIENVYNADFEVPEQEAEMRIKIFYFASRKRKLLVFIKSYLDSLNRNETESFNAQFLKLLSTKYQNFLFNTMKISEGKFRHLLEFFGKDHKLMSHLLISSENISLYRATYDYANLKYFSYLEINRTEIKLTAKKYLTNDEYLKFISLKDLRGSILYTMYCVKQFTNSSDRARQFFPGYDLPDEIIGSLNTENVVNLIANNLTVNELKVFISSNLLFYPLCVFSSQDGVVEVKMNILRYFKNLWKLLEIHFSKDELKTWLEDKFKLIILQKTDIIFYFTKKIENYFSDSEIHDIYVSKSLLHHAVVFGFYSNFVHTSNFFANHTRLEQQKSILQSSVEIECYLDTQFQDLCYIVPKINILQASLVQGIGSGRDESLHSFKQTSQMYRIYFNSSELQELIITGSKEFIPFLVIKKNYKSCETYADFLNETFNENKKSLRDFLLSEVEPTKLNIFDLLVSFMDIEGSINLFKNLINY
ncbi:hypothetical protein ACKWTF_016189 [Chironomus riparius]